MGLLIAAGNRQNSFKPKTVSVVTYLGMNFHDYLISYQNKFTSHALISLFIQCLNEVERLHCGEKSLTQTKYLHRDIKPGNFVINHQRIVSLIDFGFSRLMPEGEFVDTKPKGTDGYMAPEVFKRNAYSSKTDIYALGKVFGLIIGYSFELKNNRTLINIYSQITNKDPKKRPAIAAIRASLYEL